MIFVSRIVAKKNLDYLLECIDKVPAPYKVHLEVWGDIGEPEYGEKCKQLIAELKNATAEYKGFIQHSDVFNQLQNSHLYTLLTHGENFGHSIYESFAVGRPVLISDATPWKNLYEKGVGWNLTLQPQEEIIKALIEAANWTQEQFEVICDNSLYFADNYCYDNKLIVTHIEFFS